MYLLFLNNKNESIFLTHGLERENEKIIMVNFKKNYENWSRAILMP